MSGDLIQHNETILKLETKTNVLTLILDVKTLKDANEWHLYKHTNLKRLISPNTPKINTVDVRYIIIPLHLTFRSF